MNRLTDANAGWWPFLHLRPAPSETMDNRRHILMALHFGPLFGGLLYACFALFGIMPWSAPWALFCIATGIVIFFVTNKYTFAIFWNCRAERLRGGGE